MKKEEDSSTIRESYLKSNLKGISKMMVVLGQIL